MISTFMKIANRSTENCPVNAVPSGVDTTSTAVSSSAPRLSIEQGSALSPFFHSTPKTRIAIAQNRQHDLRQRQDPVHAAHGTAPARWTTLARAAVCCCTIAPTEASKKLVKLVG